MDKGLFCFMRFPFFDPAAGEARGRAEDIPTIEPLEDPRHYRPHPDLSHAVNVALLLGMPLLVTGEPGTGKTQLAYAVQQQFGCPLFRFDTKSTSTYRDLFYTYDAMSAFKERDEADHLRFIRYQALGLAILNAFPADHPKIRRMLPGEGKGGHQHAGPVRSIVLIDEIDKAPRDFPNDLLNQLEQFCFRVHELDCGTPGADPADQERVPAALRPIVIMTSNSEKGLPEAFLRRCVYFDIPFPDEGEMREIVVTRLAAETAGEMAGDWAGGLSGEQLKDALSLFYALRPDTMGRRGRLKRPPSTAELINWLRLLSRHPDLSEAGLKQQPHLLQRSMPTLVKIAEDQDAARSFLTEWCSD